MHDAWGEEWDDVADVVVVGTGAAASAAALAAALAGSSVIVLEKAQFTSGTTGKSGGVMWIPNNPIMQARGIADPRPEALQYLARTAYPAKYRVGHPTLGLSAVQYENLETIYDHGNEAISVLLEAAGKELEGVDYPDYYAALPQDAAPNGRVVQLTFPDGWRKGIDPTGGQLLVEALLGAAQERGAKLLMEHEAAHLVRNADVAVVGLEVRAGKRTVLIGARQGVVFGTGGFLHDPDLAGAFLRGPVFGGGAVEAATGDFVRIGIEAGAQLGNMTHAWWNEVAVEMVVRNRSTSRDVYSPFGDSMVIVNKYGKRVVNEKVNYNDRGTIHSVWDPTRFEYPNLLLFMIFDDAVMQNPEPNRFRWPIPMPGEEVPTLLFSAPTLVELGAEIRRRLSALADHVGDVTLGAGFDDQLADTIARFDAFAAAGDDEDFGRGATPIEQTWAGAPRGDNPLAAMHPFAESGPYHCVILGPGALDTKGGPVVDGLGRVLGLDGAPIEGLYGAGNCTASPAGQAYWGPGGTIGPAVTFGYVAARHAAGVARRTP